MNDQLLSLPLDTLLDIIKTFRVEDLLMMRRICKYFKDLIIGNIKHLSISQTIIYIDNADEFRRKHDLLRKVMPKLESMEVHLIYQQRGLSREEGEKHRQLIISHVKDRFSWLKHTEIKISCQIDIKCEDYPYYINNVIEYLFFYLCYYHDGSPSCPVERDDLGNLAIHQGPSVDIGSKFCDNEGNKNTWNFSIHKIRLEVKSNEYHKKKELGMSTIFKLKSDTSGPVLTVSSPFKKEEHDLSSSFLETLHSIEGYSLWKDVKKIKLKLSSILRQGPCHYVYERWFGVRCNNYCYSSFFCVECLNKEDRKAKPIPLNLDGFSFRGIPLITSKNLRIA